MELNEFADVLVVKAEDTWYESLEGRRLLALLVFSKFNGTKVLFDVIPTELPKQLEKHYGRPIHPQNIILV